jgi:hypothetical protein
MGFGIGHFTLLTRPRKNKLKRKCNIKIKHALPEARFKEEDPVEVNITAYQREIVSREAVEGPPSPMRITRKIFSRYTRFRGLISGKSRSTAVIKSSGCRSKSRSVQLTTGNAATDVAVDDDDHTPLKLSSTQLSSAEIMDRRLLDFDTSRNLVALLHLEDFRNRVSVLLDSLLNDELIQVPVDATLTSWKQYLANRRELFCSDDTLLRYLRARDSDLNASLEMLVKTIRWRAEHIDVPAWNASKDPNGAAARLRFPTSTAATSGIKACFTPLPALESCDQPKVASCAAAPTCLVCLNEVHTAHCFNRIGVDRAGRHVIYSCAGRAVNKVARLLLTFLFVISRSRFILRRLFMIT